MLTLKARNAFNKIQLQEMQGGSRPLKKGGVLAGNDILDGMMIGGKSYSLKKFARDVGKVEKTVAKQSCN